MRTVIVILVALMLSMSSYAEVITGGIAERGLFFYKCNPGYIKQDGKCVKPPKEEEKEVKPVTSEPTDLPVIALPELEKNVDASTYEFPMTEEAKRIPALRNFFANPNDPKNVENMLGWTAKHYNYVANLGYQIQSAVNMKGDKIYPVKKTATSPLGSVYAAQEEDQRLQELLQKYRDRIGIFYIYKIGCPACENMKPILSLLRQKHPYLNIKAITNTDKFDPDYQKLGIKSYTNMELISQLGVSQTPTIIGVIELADGTPKYAGLGTSFTPLDMIEKQLIRMLINEGVISPTTLNPNRSTY